MMQRLKLEQVIKIGARGSPLSLAQTGQLRALLGASLGIATSDFETHLPIIPIVTTGDRIVDRPLAEAGGKGLFTKELDEALLDGRIDCAIHSLKDVPTQLPDDIILLAGPKREDRRDALVTLDGASLADLKEGAIIGSASLRRGTQLRFARPDLRIVSLRGNVGTRLEKLRSGTMDGTLLAAAGLARLGLSDVPHVLLDPLAMPPAIGQGALAITARAGDDVVRACFEAIADRSSLIETTAERAFLTALDGSCRTAIGAYALLHSDGTLTFIGEALNHDGSQRWRQEESLTAASLETAQALGFRLGLALKAQAGEALLEVTT
jgi:hydroxymethylbilane synthase